MLWAVAGRLLGDLATADERQAVLRGLPDNPTTEMDLELWQVALQARADTAARRALLDTPVERLAQGFRAGTLPPALQRGLAGFLERYGHRGVAEIDAGLPRWSEDPTYVLGVLVNYLRLADPDREPDAQFRRAASAAEAMVATLTRRARTPGRLRGAAVGFCLRRARMLFGLRELPKYCLVLLLARARSLLLALGAELAQAGRLEAAEDIFFLDLAEARRAVDGADLRAVVRERRAGYERDMGRRHVPRVLLSDGMEPEAEATPGPADGAAGTVVPAPTGEGPVAEGPTALTVAG